MDAASAEWTGAVVAGVMPGQPTRVVEEAARYAALFGCGLIAAHVDVTRFVSYEDPDGTPRTAPIDLSVAGAALAVEQIRAEIGPRVEPSGIRWTVRSLVGDPAMALKALADAVEAPLIVVGTRRRGIGESIREFFTGSVAARLTHRQHRPVLVVPLQDRVPLDEPWSD